MNKVDAIVCILVNIFIFFGIGYGVGSAYTRDAIHKEAASHGVGLYQRNSYGEGKFAWREIYVTRDGEQISSIVWPAKQ